MLPGWSNTPPPFFNPVKQSVRSFGAGSTTPVFGDFNEDYLLDVFFPPDDDVSDLGQAYLAFGGGSGVIPSIDFEPSHEYSTADTFIAYAQTCDMDLDGHLDILSQEHWFGHINTVTRKVHRGKGSGQFLAPVVLFSTPVSQPHPNLVCVSPHLKACKVTLTHFTATNSGNHIVLDWETTSETDSIAFRIWRATPKEGKGCSAEVANYSEVVSLKAPANPQQPLLIHALGNSERGAHYAHVDICVRRT